MTDAGNGWGAGFALLDALRMPVVLLAADRTMLAANRAAIALAGGRPEQLLGQPCYRLFHRGAERPPPGCPLERAMEVSGEQGVEMRVEALGGTYLVSCAPVRDPGGGPTRYLHVVHDLSERLQVEEALRASERRLAEANQMLQLVLDTIPVRIFWKDRESRFLGCNRLFARDAGRASPAELTGLTDADMGWRDQAAQYVRDDRLVMESGLGKVGYEEPQTSPSGATLWLRTTKVPLRDLDGRVIGLLGTYEDITAQKRAEAERERLDAQLQQSVKMEALGRLAGGVAHDFNNLLTSILGFASLGLLELKSGDPLHPILQDVHRAAESAAHLTRQLLAFARKQVIEPRVLDLREVLTDLERLLGRVIGEDVELRAAPGEEPAAVRVDPGQVEQILVNLAVNARDAMPGGGRLTISLGPEELGEARAQTLAVPPGRYVRLTVADTGQGMDDEVRAHLFEPFFTTKPRGHGTGLGLASVYGAVRQAGGAIDVDTAPGRGAAFHIFLPAQEGPPTPLARPGGGAGLPAGSEAVLLVEDDAVVREAGRRLLERLGYRVWCASSGEEALRLATGGACPLELLLSDVVMPGMNGVELAARLRELRPGLPVVLTSGYAEEAVARFGPRVPGARFLPKPYTPESLSRSLREALGTPAEKP